MDTTLSIALEEASVSNMQGQHGPHIQPPPTLAITTEDFCLQEMKQLPKLVRQLARKAESFLAVFPLVRVWSIT